MLEALSPEELAEARVARRVVPLEDGWRQAGTIAAAAHNNFERDLAIRASRSSVSPSRWREPDDFIPFRKSRQVKAVVVDQASIDAHQAAMESRYLKRS